MLYLLHSKKISDSFRKAHLFFLLYPLSQIVYLMFYLFWLMFKSIAYQIKPFTPKTFYTSPILPSIFLESIAGFPYPWYYYELIYNIGSYNKKTYEY